MITNHDNIVITAEDARNILGVEEHEQKPLSGGYQLSSGKWITMEHNTNNRGIYRSRVLQLKQEILRKRWRINGESMSIGERGSVLNGQHTLLALIEADEELRTNPEEYPLWKEKTVFIEKLVVFGISESDEVVNTIDTGRERSLRDVMYRSPYFSSMSEKERKICARMAENAIRFLWYRIGYDKITYRDRMKQTHSESVEFLERHQRLLQYISIIRNLDRKNNDVSRVIPPGYASALLYLMSSSMSSVERHNEVPDESSLDFSNHDKAVRFWEDLASQEVRVSGVRESIIRETEGGKTGFDVKCWIIVTFWNCICDEQPLLPNYVTPPYEEINGTFKISTIPTTGGIDVGCPENSTQGDPTLLEIEEGKKSIRDEKKTHNYEEGESVLVLDSTGEWLEGIFLHEMSRGVFLIEIDGSQEAFSEAKVKKQ